MTPKSSSLARSRSSASVPEPTEAGSGAAAATGRRPDRSTPAGTSSGVLDGAAFVARLTELDGGQPASVAVLDIDHFQEVNERHGRGMGDRVLRRVEKALLGSLPKGAFVARLGGDEYAAALPDQPAEGALILLEEVRRHLAGDGGGERGTAEAISVSVGIAAYPAHASEREELLKRAGEALYRAKHEGRGRCAIYVESRMVLKSNYYSKASLARLAQLAEAQGRTEASLLREALDEILERYRDAT